MVSRITFTLNVGMVFLVLVVVVVYALPAWCTSCWQSVRFAGLLAYLFQGLRGPVQIKLGATTGNLGQGDIAQLPAVAYVGQSECLLLGGFPVLFGDVKIAGTNEIMQV